MSVFRIPGRLGLLAVAMCALAACGKDDADAVPPPSASGPQLVSAPPPRDALPDCPRLASTLGDMVAGLEVVLADGSIILTGTEPAGAAGPDLTSLFIGSEGTLGIITKAVLTSLFAEQVFRPLPLLWPSKSITWRGASTAARRPNKLLKICCGGTWRTRGHRKQFCGKNDGSRLGDGAAVCFWLKS